MIKDSSFNPSGDADDKYRNEDYLMKVFAARDEGELEKIKKVHNLSDEQIALFCDFARLRSETLKKMDKEVAERRARNPKASDEELDMGAYIEQIEPQVREAVLILRRKGYNAYLSGFSDFDSQAISFTGERLRDFIVPEKLRDELRMRDAELIVEPGAVKIRFSRFHGLEEIGEMWDKVAHALPPLGREAALAKIRSAETFRRKQEEIKV